MDHNKYYWRGLGALMCGLGFSTTASAGIYLGEELPDEPTEYLSDEELPSRNGPILELGPKFLSTGNIASGITLPTGAVWTPSLWVYGNLRSAVSGL